MCFPILFLVLASTQPYDSFIPDDYPVTNEMLEKFHTDNTLEEIYAYDKAWFINQEKDEILVFDLYTDYFRLAIYHCTTDFLTSDLINLTKIHRKINSETITKPNDINKMLIFQKLILNAIQIDDAYFTSNEGIYLGVSKNDILSKLGSPTRSSRLNNIEILGWDYMGEFLITEIGKKPKGKVAKNSWGYHINMYFKLNKLEALIIKNDIP